MRPRSMLEQMRFLRAHVGLDDNASVSAYAFASVHSGPGSIVHDRAFAVERASALAQNRKVFV